MNGGVLLNQSNAAGFALTLGQLWIICIRQNGLNQGVNITFVHCGTTRIVLNDLSNLALVGANKESGTRRGQNAKELAGDHDAFHPNQQAHEVAVRRT